MKNLANTFFSVLLVLLATSYCAAQSGNTIALEANSITVKNFPDSETILKALESGKAAFRSEPMGESTWNDVKERLLIPLMEGERPKGYKSDNPEEYFKYAMVNMVRFVKGYEGKRVAFFIPGEMFETGIAKFILEINYDDFKKIVNKEYTFKVDF